MAGLVYGLDWKFLVCTLNFAEQGKILCCSLSEQLANVQLGLQVLVAGAR
jgi:hypothetical protein